MTTEHEQTQSTAPSADPTSQAAPEAPQPDAAPPAAEQPADQPAEQPKDAPQHEAQPEAAPGPVDAATMEAPAIDADTQAELDAAMSAMELGDAPQPAKAKLRGPRVVEGGREHRSGAVVSVGPNDIFIEFGPKELGVLDRQQIKNEADLPKVGDQLDVVVQRFDPNERLYICVLPGTIQKADWELLQPGQNVEAKVTGTNKGGLEVEVAGHRAFIPASQVDIDRVPDLSIYVGEKLECQVQRIDRRGKGNIVLSRRELMQTKREEAAKALKETLKEGETLEGTVRKIMPFGAFVDLGGVDGLVHVTDLTHDRVGHGEKAIEKFVQVGKKVRVQVLKVDWDSNRISLGMKQLEADPFAEAAAEVVEGATLTGKVTKILEFGCFVEVAPGVEGLVHISEIDYKRINAVSDAVQEGEVVQVQVLKVDPGSRKISLSIKATKDAPPQSRGGGGRGRGRGDRDDRSADEILKETPQLRRMREQAKRKEKEDAKKGGGLGDLGGFGGMGLGDLKL